MSALWWLSFCNADLPEGSQFLGASIVPGVDMVDAVRHAHALCCNPGGEVQGAPFPDEIAEKIRTKFPHLIGRLMNRSEAEAFDGTIGVN